MNAQDELDKISDNLRSIPNKIEYVSLHPIYCECATCKAVQYKEKLIRERRYTRVGEMSLARMLKERSNG
jgi:hypothetical protein